MGCRLVLSPILAEVGLRGRGAAKVLSRTEVDLGLIIADQFVHHVVERCVDQLPRVGDVVIGNLVAVTMQRVLGGIVVVVVVVASSVVGNWRLNRLSCGSRSR